MHLVTFDNTLKGLQMKKVRATAINLAMILIVVCSCSSSPDSDVDLHQCQSLWAAKIVPGVRWGSKPQNHLGSYVGAENT